MATALNLRMASVLAAICFALSASPLYAGQFGAGHGTAVPQVHQQFGPQFTPPPFPRGAPAFPVAGPPVPGYNYHYGYGSKYNGYYGGYGYRGFGGAYVMPYYYPVDPSLAYGYDYVGAGPDLYSGPPLGPNDPSLHMIVEQPPVDPYAAGPENFQPYPDPPPVAAAQPTPTAPEPKPAEPIVLVFRNGHQQEVTNYAIMGDSLYVFDKGRRKIALADLDIPATVKANDDRGVEFEVPPSAKKKTSPAPQSGTPDQSASSPAKIAT
jgi:hypothetical protein